jgi:signal transduction histidine kinase
LFLLILIMTAIKKHNYVQIICLAICLAVFFVLLIQTQNSAAQRPFDDFITLYLKSAFTKAIWTFTLGFFIAISTVFAITYLFVRNNKIILWYMALGLSLSMGYIAALLPYYFEGPAINFIFYSLNNASHLCVILCGIKVIQNVTFNNHKTKFYKATLITTIGFLFCNFAYFTENNNYFLPLFLIYWACCMILLFECFSMMIVAFKQKLLDIHFIYSMIILGFISFSQAFPITKKNVEFIHILRLTENTMMPFAIAIFLALIFSKSMKDYNQKSDRIEALIVEKKSILETQNENLAIQVAEQTSELKALISTKDRLFSIIGHDLRSPIASLKGVLLLLDNQQLSREEFNELIQYLHKNVDNVHAMLENLLQWSLSQMKSIKPSLKSFDINDIVEQTVELFKDVAKQKQIDLQTDISENLIVFADENHIRAVVRNLINNALKFTPKNGQVSISGKFKNNYVVLQITDTGIGINTDEIALIFTSPKLKQGTLGEKGTGLGLILCQDLIKQNFGKINVRSELQRGTTFEVLLPQKEEYS